jgi:3-dehydroquinate synthetase
MQLNAKKIKLKKLSVLEEIIEESVKTKAKIVTSDEKEKGLRAILNFGHTFGHAIEAHSKYKGISHGAAVTLGMVIAAKISFYEGYIRAYQLDDMINLIESLGLNIDYSKYSYEDLKGYILNDKKVSKGKLNLILINNKGKAFKTDQYKIDTLRKAFI